jgi:glycerate kinase
MGSPPAFRYLVVPDKFKGTLTAVEAASAMVRGIRRSDSAATTVELPFADGGEGTIDAIVHAGGERRVTTVTGPLGAPVQAAWALRAGTAFIEMAQSSGLRHVDPTPDSALRADTGGTGELIKKALDAGSTRVVIGAGGSATTDGGFGALRALGLAFLDERGRSIERVEDVGLVRSVDDAALDPRLARTTVEICADVVSPLTGTGGAASVFGPQKGADASTVTRLEQRLQHLDKIYSTRPAGRAASETGGAAGGLAAGLIAVLDARMRRGVDLLAELLDLDDHIARADVVVVGEGSLDEQSRFGKAPVGIARRALALSVPVIAVVGTSTIASDALRGDGIVVIASAIDEAPTRAAALDSAAEYVEAAAATAVCRFVAERVRS